jgi:hypothetical protein
MKGGYTMTLTADMVTPISTAVTSGITVLLPIGITIMGALIGVSLIPKIIYRFF